jgi:AraC family transcriptional regulator
MPVTEFAPERFEDGKPMLLAGLRRRHEFAAAQRGIAEQWQQFAGLAEPPGRVGTQRYGIMCGANATGLEFMTAVEVAGLDGVPQQFGRMRVPPQRYAVFLHAEGAPLQSSWRGILAWLEAGDYASAHRPDFEVYGADADPIAGAGRIEIWVGVVPRAR